MTRNRDEDGRAWPSQDGRRVIRAISAYGQTGASSRVRLLDWFAYLGLVPEVHNYAGFPDNRPARLARHPVSVANAERQIRALDVAGSTVVLSREATPFSKGEVEERLLRQADWGVFDFDDAIFAGNDGIRRLSSPHRKVQRTVRAADVVIAGNAYLAEWASHYSDAVQVIPSCVHPDDYQTKRTWAVTEMPTIVWLGSPSTEGYVADVLPALTQVCERTGAQLLLISGVADNAAFNVLGPSLKRVPWSLTTVSAALASADVAIAPLKDSVYARGKCAYKLLQYAATGLPIVGSPVGANALALTRFDGLQASTNDEWADALLEVLQEPEVRRERRGDRALSAVREHYSFAAWEKKWIDAIGKP